MKGTARTIYSILPQLQGNMEYIARGYDILPGCRYCLKKQTISAETASSPKILNVVQC